MITVPAGEVVIEEGEEGAEAYIVARGELEVRARADRGARSRAGLETRRSLSEDSEAGAAGLTWRPDERRALRRDGAPVARARVRRASSLPGRRSCSWPPRGARGRGREAAGGAASSWRRTAGARMVANLVRTSPVLVAVSAGRARRRWSSASRRASSRRATSSSAPGRTRARAAPRSRRARSPSSGDEAASRSVHRDARPRGDASARWRSCCVARRTPTWSPSTRR